MLDGEPSLASRGAIAGVSLAVPHIAIETVSAGGGSIGWLDSGRALRVGPESAGAHPGPACYGRGGTQPTITDAYVTLGWIPDRSVLGGTVTVSCALARAALEPLAAAAGLDLPACALGMIRVAEATMARALRRVSVERGLDPAALTLVAFGGAGPLSACALADLLGVRRVLLPPLAGALSALGMAAAQEMVERTAAVHLFADAFGAAADGLAARLAGEVAEDLPGATVTFVAECRYAGQGYELDVPVAAGAWADVPATFHSIHYRAFGHAVPAAPVEIVELRAIGRVRSTPRGVPWPERDRRGSIERRTIRLEVGEVDAAGYHWEYLAAGQAIAGPAVVQGASATALIPPAWAGRVNAIGAIVAEQGDARPR